MTKLGLYLDAIKEQKRLTSDAQLAKLLLISRQHLSQVRKTNTAGQRVCVDIAKHIKTRPLEVLSLVEYWKTEDASLKRVWLDIYNSSRRSTD